jgi:hypothetical protein
VTRLGDFLPIGLLWETRHDFFQDEVAQRIEEHVLETNARKQLSLAATDV